METAPGACTCGGKKRHKEGCALYKGSGVHKGKRQRPKAALGACGYCHRSDGTHTPSCKRHGPKKKPGRKKKEPVVVERMVAVGPVDTLTLATTARDALDRLIEDLEHQLGRLRVARAIIIQA